MDIIYRNVIGIGYSNNIIYPVSLSAVQDLFEEYSLLYSTMDRGNKLGGHLGTLPHATSTHEKCKF